MKSFLLYLVLLWVLLLYPAAALSRENPAESDFYFKRGQKYFKQIQYEKALYEYKRALEIDPENDAFYNAVIETYTRLNNKIEAYRYLANLRSKQCLYDKALSFYMMIVSLQNYDIDALNSIGNIYYLKNDYKMAMEYFNRSLKIKRNTAAFLGRGDISYSKNLLKMAVAQYKKVLYIEPSNVSAHKRLGAVYESAGEYENAIYEYERVLKAKCNDFDAWIGLGYVYELRQDLKRAVECYNKAAELNMKSSEAYVGLGRIKAAQGSYDEARAHFEKVLQMNEGLKSIESLNGLGWLYAWQGDNQKAIRYFYKVLNIDEYNIEAKTGLGWIYSRKGDYEKAFEWYKKARTLKNEEPDNAGLIGMAWLFSRESKDDKAIKLYKEVLERSPYCVEAYNGLGDLYVKNEELELAQRFYQKSLQIKIRNPEAYYGMARIYEKRSQFNDAVGYYKTAVSFNGLNPYYKKALAICYLKNKDYKSSLDTLEPLFAKGFKDEEICNILACLYCNFGKNQEGKEFYDYALQLNPKSLDALTGLAEIYFKNENYDSAIQEYKKVLFIDSNNRAAHRGLGNIYKIKRSYDKALVEFGLLISSKNNDVESWNSIGWIYLRLKDYEKSMECYKNGFVFIKNNVDGLIGLSYVYLELSGQVTAKFKRGYYLKEAVKNCKRALIKNPYNKDALICLSKLYSLMNNYNMAQKLLKDEMERRAGALKEDSSDQFQIKEMLSVEKELFLTKFKDKGNLKKNKKYLDELLIQYKKLLRIKCNDVDIWLDLASLYKICGLYERSKKTLLVAIKYADENKANEITLSLAELYLLKKEIKHAEEIYNKLLKTDLKDNPRLYFGIGKICEFKGDLNKAITNYKKAMNERSSQQKEDYKEARLSLARILSKKDYLNEAIQIYEKGLLAAPIDNEYTLKAYKELGELYFKMRRFTKAEIYYKRCIVLNPGDRDSLIALADVAKFRQNYNEAIRLYKEVLSQDPNDFYIHKMLGNLYYWTRNWKEANKEYKLASNALTTDKTDWKKDLDDDMERLKKTSSPSVTPKIRYSESKEDDTGKANYVIQTTAWDAGLKCTDAIKNWFSILAGYDYASIKEKFITGAQVDSYIDSNIKTIGFEYYPFEKLMIEGFYNDWNFQNHKADVSSQRTPLRSDKQFGEENINMRYQFGRGNIELRGSKEPLQVKIFTDNPETDIYTKYNFLLGIDNYLTDIIKINANYNAHFYSPVDKSKHLYRANMIWEFYKHNFSICGTKKDLPLSSFKRADGFSVLDVNSVGFSYVNDWIKNLTLKTDFENGYYSDKNRSYLLNAGALFAIPRYEKLNIAYDFKYEDYKFTAGNVEGEPLYLSPQDLFLNAFSVSYKDDITKNINCSLGYTYTISSEHKGGHSAFAKTTYKLTNSTTLNLELEATDDASFTKEQKGLIYLTKHFF